jgi:hypothetical protein
MTRTTIPGTPTRPRPRHGRTTDRGSVTAEVLLFGYVIAVLLLGFGVVVIRLGSAHIDVGNAATAGARAASLQRSPAQAVAAAAQSATANLAAADTPCRQVTVAVDTDNFHPGGTVTVTVSCVVVLADLPIAVAPTRQVSASSRSPIDVYRATNP